MEYRGLEYRGYMIMTGNRAIVVYSNYINTVTALKKIVNIVLHNFIERYRRHDNPWMNRVAFTDHDDFHTLQIISDELRTAVNNMYEAHLESVDKCRLDENNALFVNTLGNDEVSIVEVFKV